MSAGAQKLNEFGMGNEIAQQFYGNCMSAGIECVASFWFQMKFLDQIDLNLFMMVDCV